MSAGKKDGPATGEREDSETTRGELLRGGAPALRAESQPDERLEGERAYRLLGLLGEGGMGRVDLAERADGEYRQRVAIKRLTWFVGRDTDAAKRFRAERQILARLNHPYIARLLDGGTTPEGQPYLVMEYIEGSPIHEFVESAGLETREILRLFLKVLEGVGFAHRNLIVHRDLKPGNILVTKEGEPKLLDFGIAKLLDPELALESAQTRRGELFLTPRYASPEQVRGEPVSTTSDVYSLGVILYELLTGEPPYRGAMVSPKEILQAICEEIPTPPSARGRPATFAIVVSSGDATEKMPSPVESSGVATPRAVRAPRLSRDLDAIVLRALRKEPDARYGSIEAFAEDLKRLLDGRPVVARQGGAIYRLSRFARRHRWSLAVAAIFLATVAAFLVGLARQLGETRRQRDEAARQRDAAREVTDFLVKIFGASDPAQARGTEITARTVLDRGAERIERELAQQPEIRTTLLHELGVVYQGLGALERSAELLREALAGREVILPPTAREVVDTRRLLGWTEAQRGNYAEGEPILRRALADLDRAPWSDAGLELEVLNSLGAVLVYQERFDDAEPFLLRGLGLRGRPETPSDAPVLATLNNLGLLHMYQEEWKAAIPRFREALSLLLAAQGLNHPSEVTIRSNLAWCLAGEGEFLEAEAESRRASDVGRRVLGSRHAATLRAEHVLASSLQNLGRFEESEAMQRSVLAARRETRAHSPTEIALSLHSLARLLRWRGEHGAALVAMREAVAVARPLYPAPDAPELLQGEAEMALMLAEAGEGEEALALISRVMASFDRLSPSLLRTEARVRQGFILAGDPARRRQAREVLRQAISETTTADRDYRLVRRAALVELADLVAAEGDAGEAERLRREALAFENDLAPGDPERGRVARALARGEAA